MDLNNIAAKFIPVKQLIEINKPLAANNLDLIYLKGTLQSYYLYHHLPKYLPLDTDILIKIKDLGIASKILTRIGFTATTSLSSSIDINLQSNTPQINFINTKNILLPEIVDLHLLILNPTDLIFNYLPIKKTVDITRQMFLRKRRIKFATTNFFILENEDMLLHQCLNFFFHHCCRGKRQLHDIADIIKILPIKWPVILKRLKKWDLEIYAHYPLLLAKKICRAPVPKDVLRITTPIGPLRDYALNYINKITIDQPIDNPRLRYRFNIWLRFLLSKKPLWKSFAEFLSPIVLLKIVKSLPFIPYLLRNIIPPNNKISD